MFQIFREWIRRHNCLGHKIVCFWPWFYPNCTIVLKKDFWGKLANANFVNILFPITQKYFKINSVEFFTRVRKTTIILGTVSEIQSETFCFVILGHFLAFTLIVCRWYKVPPEKTQSRLKSHFPPEITLLKAQQIFHTCLKLNFLFTPILNIFFKRFLRWQVNNMQTFPDKHLLTTINQQVYKFLFVYAFS